MKTLIKKIVFLLLMIFYLSKISFAQVAINDNGAAPNSNAVLDLDISTNDKGLLIPRLTTTERTNMTLAAAEQGLTVYDETVNRYYYWDGTNWQEITIQGANWSILGNSNIDSTNNFLGTTNDQPIIFRTNNNTRMIISSVGNVGIGTTSPTVPLHIASGSDATYSDGSGYMIIGDENARNLVMDVNEILARNNGATSSLYLQNLGGNLFVHYDCPIVSHDDGTQFAILDNGHVGIGTWQPPVMLYVTRKDADPDVYVASWGTDGSAKLRLCENASGTYYGFEFFYNGTENRLELWSKEYAGNDANRITVLKTGFVGFGTNNPQKILHLKTGVPYIRFEDTDDGSYWEAGNSNGEFRFYEGTLIRAEISNGGDVGIGTGTGAPQSKLHVVKTGTPKWQSSSTVATFQNNANTSDSSIISIVAGNASAAVISFADAENNESGRILYDHNNDFMSLFTNGTEQLRITSSGNVGIGVNSPSEKLHVNGGILLGNSTNTNAGTIRWNGSNFQGYNGTSWVDLDVQASASAGGWTDDGTVVRLTTGTDNVGIGTTSPGEKLEVNGHIRMTDGNQSDGYIMVSDANGTASWSNETDGVKTRIIRQINGGSSTEVVIWTHPEGIEVRFNPGSETVTVENKTGDNTHYWDVVIYGGATGRETVESTNYKADFIRDDGTNDLLSFDMGTNNMGWFDINCADQNNEKDGFIMHIVYYGDDLNGTVQYWDN